MKVDDAAKKLSQIYSKSYGIVIMCVRWSRRRRERIRRRGEKREREKKGEKTWKREKRQ